jgi:predicted ester cyclase
MSRDATKNTMDAYLEALLNGGDFAQYFAPDILWTTVETGDTMSGRETVRDFIVALHTKMFDAHPEIQPAVVGDGVAAVEAVFIGRHIGEFGGIPPTGADVRLPYTVFYDVTDEGITQLRAYLSVQALIDQLRQPQTAAASAGA